MKKNILILGLAVLTLGAFVSCDKDYVCDCHSHDHDSGMEDREYEFTGSKSDAEEYCEGRESHLEDDHGYNDVHCQLK